MTREDLLQTAKPIIFNFKMNKAFLAGRKSCMRVLVKDSSVTPLDFNVKFRYLGYFDSNFGAFFSRPNADEIHDVMFFEAPYNIGDTLYVKEKTFGTPGGIGNQDLCYALECPCGSAHPEDTA